MKIMLRSWLGVLVSIGLAPSGFSDEAPGDHVILLHGLGRTRGSMELMARELVRAGYVVHNVGYPSMRHPVARLAEGWLGPAIRSCDRDGDHRIHFVTHSLGAIVLRQYLRQHEVSNLGRVVMLAPPNGGSELADALSRSRLFRALLGPALSQLGTAEDSVVNRLGPASFTVGVIAGDRTVDPWFTALIPGPDDGKVPVARTVIDGMADFRVVHASHTWIMRRREVIRQTVCFLRDGRFAVDGRGGAGVGSSDEGGRS